ncbi:MAG: alkaline phosphatase PhoX [Cyanobacteria bacterium P01_E01_bin.45]
MKFNRRQFLMMLGASAGATAASNLIQWPYAANTGAATAASIPFPTLLGAMPILTSGIEGDEPQIEAYSEFSVSDDVVLPEGYTYDVVAAWGDDVGDSRFGYNNDYLSFVETGPGNGFLTINFEYISGATWLATFPDVIGGSVELGTVTAALSEEGEIDVFSLDDSDPIKTELVAVAREAMIDQGIGVISIRRNEDGSWERTFSASDRRITGISGLDDDRYLKATGPAVAIFEKAERRGYDDGLGAQIIGTFGNCSGGTTPWGTVLSAEENFQNQVVEPVLADGSSPSPADSPVVMGDGDFNGHGNTFGLAGNKYGWMVEVDPANPDDFGTKHTWLGRFRHEAVAVRAEAGAPLAVYSGCDRRSGHVYKFVSTDAVADPADKSNSALMGNGVLYAAKFNEDGTGEWIALNPDTPVNPVRPSDVFGEDDEPIVVLPQRPEGGVFKAMTDADIDDFSAKFSTLADLYEGTSEEKQGAILIDAHYAANAAGATTTARPEDTDLAPDGSIFIAFTSGIPGSDGGPNKAIFSVDGAAYEHGWIFKLVEDDNAPGAMTFTWERTAVGGEPVEGGLGFSNPDNLEFDSNGNLWMVTDMSSSRQNKAVPAGRVDEEGEPLSQSSLRGLFGNNSVWYIPTSGENAGQAYLFAYGPMDCEMTGPFVTADNSTLFLAAQHPGEVNGVRQDMASEVRDYEMRTTGGATFMQKREVPVGSNWPAKTANSAPRPAVVAVRRTDNQPLV